MVKKYIKITKDPQAEYYVEERQEHDAYSLTFV